MLGAEDPVTDSTIILERIRAAMTVAEVKQQDLGAALGLSKSVMSRVMSGQRKLSAAELGAIADRLEVPVAQLLGRTSSGSRPLAVAARLGQTEHDVQLNPAFGRARSLLELRALLDRIVQGPPAQTVARIAPPSTSMFTRAAAQMAVAVREQLGLGDEPVEHLPELLRAHFGIDVSLEPMPGDIAGLFITDPAGSDVTDRVAVMLVNSSDPFGRQRFTTAHELGHHLFEDAELFWVDYRGGKTMKEQRANAFASCFLMPEGGLRKVAADLGPAPTDEEAHYDWVAALIVDVSLRFGVSVESATIRCSKLGIISGPDKAWAEQERAHRLVGRARRASDREALEVHENVVAPPPALVEQALFAYAEGMVGIGPLAELWLSQDAEALRRQLAKAEWAPDFADAST
jgi:Zn-dependent peptidase ImmA (M78 family)